MYQSNPRPRGHTNDLQTGKNPRHHHKAKALHVPRGPHVCLESHALTSHTCKSHEIFLSFHDSARRVPISQNSMYGGGHFRREEERKQVEARDGRDERETQKREKASERGGRK